jgi:hypothetical protein
MPTLPSAYQTLITPLIDTARETAERGETLATMAFVGNLDTGETRIVPIVDQQKDASLSAIRHIAHLIGADFVFTIAEGWGLPRDKVQRFQEILDRYGSIGASPYRVDTVNFLLETHHGLWSAQLPFRPKGVSKKKRTFGEPELTLGEEMQGRFVGLLPLKKDEDRGAADGPH